jgi:hypothetical protein
MTRNGYFCLLKPLRSILCAANINAKAASRKAESSNHIIITTPSPS